jgi:DNA/RNA-binding domain of Phe-tRNA-synthetase-like protein
LEANLPISLLSVAKCSSKLGIKRATAGESFVFNSVGQTLELEDLITVYDCDKQPPRPVGTPVKDSMAGKIESTDNHLVAIIYSPKITEAVLRAQSAADRLARGMKDYCGARQAQVIESLA